MGPGDSNRHAVSKRHDDPTTAVLHLETMSLVAVEEGRLVEDESDRCAST
jgi:hypothetical protein